MSEEPKSRGLYSSKRAEANIADLKRAMASMTSAQDIFNRELMQDHAEISDEIHLCLDEIDNALSSTAKVLSRMLFA